MMDLNEQRCRNLLVALRKIIQAIDQHSTQLKKKFGLTGPQLIILQTVVDKELISVTQLSKDVSLSQATVTNITKRLEYQGYLDRDKDTTDKRKINLMVTEKGKAILEKVPPLLQEKFTSKFSKLEDWEQLMIESAFNRVVSMMAAEDIEASPIMITGEVIETK
ncbi:MAG: MarR family transcriptional regulator [Desulfobacula sp.]|jgi:DNA-binding MarR family transcriptional regulator|uniref:MarR family winged helix-turn-helix transcriptional regulator n=1 Tax=Desulfobacula sp. TaxID=2593537 RepID=UPI001D5149B3|nr:MarR family transcriptional regulator [Desulfobacula sp.]MBT3805029.1 MarR family transcriptional regulator [Desulfobacula sp.]MBT4024113.1 MarR family transcriptional regulator [Desulfobacula sp.]MBT4197437.1 MarR family transcriptional regulator [Desulfobacula sp.]MBT4505708.1 MarR family transcriptional regulator [Desulfobacula sp.]